MSRNRILAIIQAGGAGGRMDVLTRERAKPALPFAGVYQLVDFPLSNLAHSGITEVWLSLQYQGASIEEPVANGRPWDLDRNRGGLRLLMPEQGTGTDGGGRVRAGQRRRAVPDPRPDPDRRPRGGGRAERRPRLPLRLHRRRRDAPPQRRRVHRGDHARCRSRRPATTPPWRPTTPAWSPASPTSPTSRPPTTVATEIFVYDPQVLVEVLEELHRERSAGSAEGDSGLGDFGEHLAAPARRARPHRRARAARLLARPRPAAPLPRRAPGRALRRPGAVRRPALADPDPPAAARPGPDPRRRRRVRQHRVAGGPGRRRRTAQRARARRGRRGGRRGPQQRAVRRHRRRAGRGRRLGDRRRGLPWSRPARWWAGRTPTRTGDPDQVTIVGTRQPGRRGARAPVPGSSPAPPSRRRPPRRHRAAARPARLSESARSGSPPQSRSDGRR